MTDFVSYFDYRRHPPTRPATAHGRDPVRHRVAIVGGGPVGFAMALGLARHGIASVVLEADDTVCAGSRAGCITDRTLQTFARLGVAEPHLRQGLPWSEGWSYWRTQEVLHLQVPQDPHARYPRLLNIQQCYIEQFLLDRIETMPGLVEVRWCNRVTGVEARDDGVALQVDAPGGGYALDADWVVATDGAHSTVRKALGLRFVGTKYDGTYVIVDIMMKSALPAGRRAWFDPPSNPGATLLLHKHRGDLWRFDYQLRDDEDPEVAVRPENVLERVRSHLALMGETQPWDPVWISLYRASCLTLERYRHGRVLLAGDAAHLVPIFGVRGLNSGVDDTANLAWKLAWVAEGRAPARLLDTYSDERVHATRENMRHASKSCEFMAPPSPAFRLMREAALSLAVEHDWIRRLVDPRQSASVGYPDSPLNADDDGARFAGGPARGFNLADAPLDDGTALADAIGTGFTVLLFGDAPFEPLPAPAGGVPTVLRARADGPLAQRHDARPGTCYVYRPDGHVLGRWREADPRTVARAIEACCDGGRP